MFSRYWQHLFSWWPDSLIYCSKTFLIHNIFLFPKLPQNSNLKCRHIDQIDSWLTLYLFYSSIFLQVSFNRSILFHIVEKETQITLKKHRAHPEMESLFYLGEQASRSHKLVKHVVMPDVRIPERDERRPSRQCNSQKGKFTADSSQGSCHIQRSGVGSESPEPKLLHKFIGWAHAVGSWFKQIAKQFHWSKLSSGRDFPGDFRPIPNWQTAVSVKLIQVAW